MDDLLKSLDDMGYTGELLDATLLEKALNDGPKSIEYTKLIEEITSSLRDLCKIDEQVNAISSPEDSAAFLMELSSFLKELGCPYESLTHGHITDRLSNVNECKILLEYLITELMAARIIADNKPDETISLKIKESTEALNLKKIMLRLGLPKPPANLKISNMFIRITQIIETAIKKNGADFIGKPIFNLPLSDKQWHVLEQVQKDLHVEYTIRRQMLLKRLDCTVQSFQWSDKMKGREDQITKTFNETRKQLKIEPDVHISDLLSAREDLAIIEKTSNASVRKHTKSSINKVIIGQVPDRGGRTNELAPPPPEMPSWQQRTPGPSGGAPRGGRGGGGRGRDQHHGGMQSNDYNRGGGNDYSSQRGDYNNQRGGDYNRGGRSDYNNQRGGNYNQGHNYNQGNYQSQSSYDNRPPSSSSYTSFDSAGSYGVYQDSKRPKTYDNFQTQKQGYADQYVQESQQNQQYHRGGGRGGRGGRGRSNYNRGGY
ncbi:protein FAM98A [Onthophagus taurus]|uniref:protein FAM98A n=1 Tax=Onthophagus taurus TaxID=166361 RepID=UPI000C20B4DC|nr:protein FAM98A [Onthophagus taurus]